MRTSLYICALVATLLVGGCRLFDHSPEAQGQSPLRPLKPSPDSVAVEIIWVRFPPGDAGLHGDMWSQIDETQIAPAARRELAHNGFRAGVIAGTPPGQLARALKFDAYRSTSDATPADQLQHSLDLMAEPTIHGSVKQIRRGQRVEIQASEVLESMPLLVSRGRDVGGDTYYDAQAIYALRIDPQADQTVAVELTPELHHGQPRIRWSGGDEGILRQLPLRDREVFDAMRMNVRLAPGEMLVLMCLPDCASRLGQYFHTAESTAGREQKLVLVRLAEVPRSDLFGE